MPKIITTITGVIMSLALFAACDQGKMDTNCPQGWTGYNCDERVSDSSTGGTQDTSTQAATTGSGSGAADGGSQQPDDGLPPYDLPEGWVWKDTQEWEAGEAPLLNRDIDAPFTGIQYDGKHAGGESEAQSMMQNAHQENQSKFEDELLPPEFRELNVNGTKVYVAMSTYFMGDPMWYSQFTFVKNEGVAEFHYGGRIDQNLDILKKIVESYRK